MSGMIVSPIPGLRVRAHRLLVVSGRRPDVEDLFAEEHVVCRKVGRTGTISGATSVNPNIVWVMHDGRDDVGVYWLDELEPTGEGIGMPTPSRMELLSGS